MVTATKDNIESRCNMMLFGLLGSHELVEKWWRSPNKAFEGRMPSELFEGDEAMMVFDYLTHHCNGDYS
jgi:hypothetical protein